jgi:hypothetical protein
MRSTRCSSSGSARLIAIDVAKASGKVCVRVPHDSRPGRRTSRVWDVSATTRAVLELGDHLRCEQVEKVTVESTSDYWRIWYYSSFAVMLRRLPRPVGSRRFLRVLAGQRRRA